MIRIYIGIFVIAGLVILLDSAILKDAREKGMIATAEKDSFKKLVQFLLFEGEKLGLVVAALAISFFIAVFVRGPKIGSGSIEGWGTGSVYVFDTAGYAVVIILPIIFLFIIPWYAIVKRGFDVTFCISFLLTFTPLYLMFLVYSLFEW